MLTGLFVMFNIFVWATILNIYLGIDLFLIRRRLYNNFKDDDFKVYKNKGEYIREQFDGILDMMFINIISILLAYGCYYLIMTVYKLEGV